MTSRRLGVLGGTFDPIHLGHLVMASEVHAALGLDAVLLVPTAQQPFKDDDAGADASHRLAMCAAVAGADARFEVSDVDVQRGGTTYTVDTLTDLAAIHADAELFFIAGADSIAQLPRWKNPEHLMNLATFVGIARQGYPAPDLEPPHVVVETPTMGVSSTEVRRRVRAGQPVRYLVPDIVVEYIDHHRLYLGGADG